MKVAQNMILNQFNKIIQVDFKSFFAVDLTFVTGL